MEGKQLGGDGGLPANLAGMTKNQLYDIMSQMKKLIDQNQQQARQILTQNPLLTKALFQAQIMLGMVQSPQAVPKIEPQASQQIRQPPQPTPTPPHLNVQPPIVSGQVGLLEQPIATQTQQALIRKQLTQTQPAIPISSSSIPAVNIQSQPMPLHPPQPRHNVPPTPAHSASQPPPFHQPEIPASSAQPQRPMHTGGMPRLASQQPLPPQPRPSPIPGYHHQYAPPQTGPSVGFQHHGGPLAPPPQHLSQPMFHSGVRPPASVGPSFTPAQLRLPSQPLSQPMYQVGGTHFGGGGDFNNQLQGHPSALPSQAGPGGSQPRPASLTPEMEKVLLQQVMSLTPEQINLLPPEQRNQVLQLQQVLRQ